jgi:hypothetical protein
MAMVKTYLDLVNKVLVRMRENTVTSVSQNILSRLYGEFVNKAKKDVEMAWNWEALRMTYTITTADGDYRFSIDELNTDYRDIRVWNDTSNFELEYVDTRTMSAWFLMGTPETGSPRYLNMNGTNSTGEVIFDVYPIPDGVYTLRVDVVAPQNELDTDTQELMVPWQPVVELAVAYAMRERGEDGGQGSMDAIQTATRTLEDWIGTEAARRPEEMTWKVV